MDDNLIQIYIKYSLDCDMKCKLCVQNDIGDEYHYFIRCDYFLHERHLFLDKYYVQYQSVYEFIYRMVP